MNNQSRRQFLQTSSVLLTAAIAGSSFETKKDKLLLSFSTLGCPDWDFPTIMSFAKQHGYKGIEVRGIKREMDLSKSPIFNTEESRVATLKLMEGNGLRFINLGSSTNLHLAQSEERKKNLDEARRFIDLAQQINCPYIRVFPNNFPKGQDRDTTIGLIVSGLKELGEYAKDKNVTVLMETHGEVVKMDDLERIMQSAAHPNVGLVWDITNMWTITKEAPAQVYDKLKKYIRHTHIKDAKHVDGKEQYTMLGKGEVPIFDAIDLLIKGGYKGFYSFEWEKMWHPEIAEPEIAFADYAKTMNQRYS
jgi:sugar phosphate isomerase/epimerase